jgi:hypothetical protein
MLSVRINKYSNTKRSSALGVGASWRLFLDCCGRSEILHKCFYLGRLTILVVIVLLLLFLPGASQ